MRRCSIALTAVFAVFVLGAAAAPAQTTVGILPDTARLVASATRSARLTPDRATLYALLEGSAETAPEAAQRAQARLRSFEDAMRRSGIAAQIAPAVPYGIGQAGSMNGYPGPVGQPQHVARYAVRMQPARLDQLLTLSGAAIAAGASYVSTPMFEASAADSVRRAQLADAIAETRLQAEAMARALGGRVGPVLEVSCTDSYNRGWPGEAFLSWVNRFEFSGGQAPTPELLVSATATVRYRLVR